MDGDLILWIVAGELVLNFFGVMGGIVYAAGKMNSKLNNIEREIANKVDKETCKANIEFIKRELNHGF